LGTGCGRADPFGFRPGPRDWKRETGRARRCLRHGRSDADRRDRPAHDRRSGLGGSCSASRRTSVDVWRTRRPVPRTSKSSPNLRSRRARCRRPVERQRAGSRTRSCIPTSDSPSRERDGRLERGDAARRGEAYHVWRPADEGSPTRRVGSRPTTRSAPVASSGARASGRASSRRTQRPRRPDPEWRRSRPASARHLPRPRLSSKISSSCTTPATGDTEGRKVRTILTPRPGAGRDGFSVRRPGRRGNRFPWQRVRGARTDWFLMLRSPVEAAHCSGSCSSRWATSGSLWGTGLRVVRIAATLIAAFRAVVIPAEMQERFGYPAAHRVGEMEPSQHERAGVVRVSAHSASTAEWAANAAVEITTSDRRAGVAPGRRRPGNDARHSAGHRERHSLYYERYGGGTAPIVPERSGSNASRPRSCGSHRSPTLRLVGPRSARVGRSGSRPALHDGR